MFYKQIGNIQNCCKQMSMGIKNMLLSVEHVSKLSNDARRVLKPRDRSKSRAQDEGYQYIIENTAEGVKR